LQTDHKPLQFILKPERGVPMAAASRIQRWCLFLAAYDYDIQFRSTEKHANCDGLSRLPCAEGPPASEPDDRVDVFALSQVQSGPITAAQVAVKSARDPILACVAQPLLRGIGASSLRRRHFSRLRHAHPSYHWLSGVLCGG